MKLWRAYLRQHRLTVLMLVLFTGLFAVSFALYGLPLAAVAYPAGLCALAGAGMAVWDFRRAARRHKEMEQLRQTGETVLAPLPEMKTVEGQDCAALVEQLSTMCSGHSRNSSERTMLVRTVSNARLSVSWTP